MLEQGYPGKNLVVKRTRKGFLKIVICVVRFLEPEKYVKGPPLNFTVKNAIRIGINCSFMQEELLVVCLLYAWAYDTLTSTVCNFTLWKGIKPLR